MWFMHFILMLPWPNGVFNCYLLHLKWYIYILHILYTYIYIDVFVRGTFALCDFVFFFWVCVLWHKILFVKYIDVCVWLCSGCYVWILPHFFVFWIFVVGTKKHTWCVLICVCVCVCGGCYLRISSHCNVQIKIRVSFACHLHISFRNSLCFWVWCIHCINVCVCVCVCGVFYAWISS